MRKFFKDYFGYLFMFLGIGFISGSIVHMPLDPTRYGTIAFVGVILFVTATIFNEVINKGKKPTINDLIKLAFSSLVLSIGIGMISGGIQHFEEEMHYASQLIPIGLFVSAVGFVWRTKGTISLKNVTIVLFVMFALSGMVKYGLHYIVDHNPEISEDTHGGHSH